MTVAVTAPARPLAVRALVVVGRASLGLAAVAAGIGALHGFEGAATIWAVLAVILGLGGVSSLLAARPSPAGLAAALVACAFMLLLVPVGTLVTIALALIGSQTWPELRAYYRFPGRRA